MDGLINKLLLCFLGLLCLQTAPSHSARRLVCYYTNWPQYRPGIAKYTVPNVDPWACTHLVFAFAKVVDSQLKPYEANDMTPGGGAYMALTNLKRINPNLVVLLAVGGWNHGPKNFTLMVQTRQSRNVFIQNSLQVLRRFNFDGIDIDWEYPGREVASDKPNLSMLLQEMRSAYNMEASRTNRPALIISMATAAGIENAVKAYDIPALDRYLDMYNVMAYDFHGAWEKFTGLAAPLNANDDKSVSAALNWYRQQGATMSKINLGMTIYGRAWTLKNPGEFRLGAAAKDSGKKGRFTGEPGALSTYEICEMRNKQNLQVRLDPLGKTWYGVTGDQFVTYDDTQSLKYKTDFIVAMGIGGAMLWSLDHDDFTGQFCGFGKNPLITFLKGAMASAPTLSTGTGPVNPPVVITQRPVIYTRAPPTYRPPIRTYRPVVVPTQPLVATRPPVVSADCPPYGGKVANPRNCAYYDVCLRGLRMTMACRGDEIFNPYSNRCEPQSTSSYRCGIVQG